MDSKGCVSIVMPVYNEEKTISEIVGRVLSRPEVGELVIVEDASTDGSFAVLEKLAAAESRIKLFRQEHNQGKGAAIIRGFAESKCPFVLIQDADFEYTPEDYPIVLEPLLQGRCDIVYGSRFMGTPGMVRFFRHEMGNKFLTFWSNFFSDIHLSDMETCYKGFKREVIQNMVLTSCRFGIEVEMTAKFAKFRNLRIWEVPISYNPRRYDEGKKITWRDGFAALWHILHFNLFVGARDSIKRPWSELGL